MLKYGFEDNYLLIIVNLIGLEGLEGGGVVKLYLGLYFLYL